MRRLHKDVFDQDSRAVSDKSFQGNLFIGPLDKSWNLPDHQTVEKPFNWVPQYLPSGFRMGAGVGVILYSSLSSTT